MRFIPNSIIPISISNGTLTSYQGLEVWKIKPNLVEEQVL